MEKNYLKLLVQKLFDRKINPEELTQLNEWYDSLESEEYPVPDKLKADSWVHIQNKIGNISSHSKQSGIFPWIARVAAAAVIVVGAYAVIQHRSVETPRTISAAGSYTNDIGVVSTFLLPDSTKVWLSSGSTLDYVADFEQHRHVTLQGEAFFQVQRDSLHPFQILIGEVTTEVLGTTFNLRGYNEESVELEVYSGKVKFSHQNNQKEGHVLIKNQKIKWDRQQGMRPIHQFDSSVAPDWKQGVFRFEEADITEIIRELEKWYPLDFKVVNGSNYDMCRYTGEFTNSSLEQVLEILSYTLSLTYQIHENEAIIKLKPCN